MGATIVSAHTKKNNTFSVVMCPSHLVKKWRSEILNTQPLSDAIIISSLSELISIDDYIMSKDRKVNLFIIMSKDIAKMDTEHRPAAIWSDRKKTFVCPKCGNPVYRETMGIVNDDSKVPELNANYPELYFITNNRYNCSCKAMTQRFYDSPEEQCDEKLWQPFNKNNTGGWIKTGSGWILKKHLRQVHDRLIEDAEKLNKKFSTVLSNISIALQQLEEDKYVVRSPRSYPIAKYIKNKYKGVLDYAILDECHQLKGKDSAQGLAAGDLINAANRTLLLTGTLLNGYASGIYYLFFRAFSKTMLNEGFGFNDNNKFQQEYGVTQMTSNQRGSYITTSKKELPGISPIVFTKFMLENSLFIGMSDISEGLPDYQEIPIPVPMDQELRQAYENFANAFRFANSDALTRKTSMQFIQGMLIYSDQPYDQPPIVDYDTDAIVYTPVELDKEKISNKEQALIDLVLRKKAQGEKVLIYYTWTGRTELGPRFVKSLSNVGVKAVELSTNVKAEDRQYWIEEQVKDGIDAFIVNPRKVETGLDLLDFTTIVFYQTGNDSYTLRQASRRSWRLSQANDVEVYFLYYQDTIQETLLNMMATKIQASMAIEGKFSEEGLNAMSQNEDFLTQIATSVVEGITEKVDVEVFQKITTSKKDNLRVEHQLSETRKPTYPIGFTVHSEKPRRRKTYKTSTTKNKDIFAITSLI